MAVNYICRYCKTNIASIDNREVSEYQLGLNNLSHSERQEMVTYDAHGNLVVHLVCDYCNEALSSNPELNLVNSPLQ